MCMPGAQGGGCAERRVRTGIVDRAVASGLCRCASAETGVRQRDVGYCQRMMGGWLRSCGRREHGRELRVK